MKNVSKHLKLYFIDTRKAFIIFWAVILTIFLAHLLLLALLPEGSVKIGFFVSNGDELSHASSFVLTALFATVIFMIIACFEMYSESFGLTTGFGSTRKDYYTGAVFFYLFFAAVMAVVLGLLYLVEGSSYSALGLEQVNIIRVFYQGGFIAFPFVIFSFSLLLLIAAFFNLLAALFYRYDNLIWLYLLVIVSLIVITPLLRQWIWDFILFFAAERSFPIFSLKILALAAAFFLSGWPAVRKAPVKAPDGA